MSQVTELDVPLLALASLCLLFAGRVGLNLMGIAEEVGGIGELFKGDTLIRSGVRYLLTVRETTVAGLSDVEPWIDLNDSEANTHLGEMLTLHLEDGRWFNFIVLSASGAVAGAGTGIRGSR